MNRLQQQIVCCAVLFTATLARAAAPSIDTPNWQIHIDPTIGSYTITRGPEAWTFTGSLICPLSNVQRRTGSDHLGPYTSLSFDWADQGPQSGEIRAYDQRPAVMFLMTCHKTQATSNRPFPTLTPPPHLSTFSYTEKVFAPHAFRGEANATPWLWFDSTGAAAIISPADNFMVSAMLPAGRDSDSEGQNDDVKWDNSTTRQSTQHASASNSDSTVASGFVSPLHDLPAGFTHATILVFGNSIHSAWHAWGHALTDWAGKHRPASDADVFLKYLGYWTDNGGGYYYNYDPAKGYTGTLLAERDELQKLGIPIGYMQLDSWWYIKTNIGPSGKAGAVSKNSKLPAGSWNCYGGLTEYVAHKDLFPNGLGAFQQQLGLPLITHNRWVDLNSPYRKRFTISGVAAIDPAFWTEIINYIHANGVAGYEQDWLNEIYRYSPAMQSTTTAGDAFTDGMAHACAADGLSMQYCMALPRLFLQGTRYDNLTSIRVSNDRFEPSRWESFLYTSQLAAALGEWPFADCLRSTELGNLILSNLSAGPVGIADLMGQTDVHNVMRVIRPDGILCKPDSPIVPIDAMYLADAQGSHKHPMIAAAHTDHGSLRTVYLFAFPRSTADDDLRIHPADMGIPTDAWLVPIASSDGPAPQNAQRIPAGKTLHLKMQDAKPNKQFAYFILAPVTHSGIALVGDANKFVAAAKQRIPEMAETPHGLTATIAFAPGENQITLYGFAPVAPTATASIGHCSAVRYDAATQRFSINVNAGPGNTAKVEFAAG